MGRVQVGQARFVFRQGIVRLELRKGALNHIFRVGLLGAQQVEKHVVLETKSGAKRVGLAAKDFLGRIRLDFLVAHENDKSAFVQAAAARSTAHLNVFAARDKAVLFAVVLAHGCEEHCFGRHIEPHGKGLGGKERLDEALLEQDFHNFLENGQQTRVVYPNAALQERQGVGNLREALVLVRKRIDGILENLLDQLPLVVIVKVELGHLNGHVFNVASRKGKNNDRLVAALHNHADDLVTGGGPLFAIVCRARR
mmetsp:Transcript_55723/g.136804  ORF Transcript_55723/g.136804 Transcript_55723/m.136804 type:complete len:254 (-) Transcript_55723:92-853(-)